MLAAHEMFKNANRVSRAEKALILGFMAGARGKEQQSTVLCVKTPRSIAGYFERERERVREGGRGWSDNSTTRIFMSTCALRDQNLSLQGLFSHAAGSHVKLTAA